MIDSQHEELKQAQATIHQIFSSEPGIRFFPIFEEYLWAMQLDLQSVDSAAISAAKHQALKEFYFWIKNMMLGHVSMKYDQQEEE